VTRIRAGAPVITLGVDYRRGGVRGSDVDRVNDPRLFTMDPPLPSSDEPNMQLRINTDIDAVLASHAPESPTTMLVDTLRTELTTLTDQASVLNAKLLASLDRVATLEDTVYHHTTAEREKDAQIVQLERAKAQWEESMNTGLLVERTAVKAEMQRLVEGLVEEERRRGSAEEGRARVENEVDDLSATLFEQVSAADPQVASVIALTAFAALRPTPWSPPKKWLALRQRPDSVKPRRTFKRQKPPCATCNTTCSPFLRSALRSCPPRTSQRRGKEPTTPRTSLTRNSSPLSIISGRTNLGNRNTWRSFPLPRSLRC
jgi:hypothetical protein